MTLWLIFGGVAALLVYIAITRARAKKAGRAEAEGEHLANFAEKIGEISERNKEIDEEADKLEPNSEKEVDDFFKFGRRRPDDGLDELRRKPRDKR